LGVGFLERLSERRRRHLLEHLRRPSVQKKNVGPTMDQRAPERDRKMPTKLESAITGEFGRKENKSHSQGGCV
jgi:hypothetical protein